jgi:hypothetical protein
MRRLGCVVAACVGAGVAAALAVWLVSGRRPVYGALASAEERPEPSPDRRYELSAIRLQGAGGGTVDCLLRRPAGGAGGPTLSVILVGGIGTGRRAATLVDGRHLALVLSCDYPWEDPSDLPLSGIVRRLPVIRSGILATPDALALAASYLLRQPDADPHRLAAIGASLGVPFAAAWAASDPRVAAVALAYGGGDLGVLFDAGLRGRFRPAWLRRVLAGTAARLLAPLEPTRTVGRIAPRPVLLVGSAWDERIPRRSVDALIAAAREPKSVVWFASRHILPRDTALMREIGDSTVAWLALTLPPPSPLSSPASRGHLR